MSTDLGQRSQAGRAADDGPSVAQPERHRPPRWWGVVVGIVAAGLGLAVGELVAGFSRTLHSPVVSVAEWVRDLAPKWMRDFAIENFDTGDKGVAIWTIVAVIFVSAAFVGVATVRGNTKVGIGFATAFGVLGILAAQRGADAGFGSIFPALLATLTAAGVLMWGTSLARPRSITLRSAPVVDRRRFLMHTGGLALGAVVVASIGRSMQDRFNATLERAKVSVPPPAKPLPTASVGAADDLAEDPANEGLSKLFTPNASFYRIDTAFDVPNVSLGSWKLGITGMVDRQLSFSFDDLSNRPLFEADITISCVSNEVGGPLVGNARWTGCRLDDLLREAGIQPDADQIMGVSVDGFTAGFPVDTLDGRDAMVAIAMNGEALPIEHGFPARIIVPGIYGYVSAVKWLEEIKLTRFDQDEGYWIPRGWSSLGPIKTQSRIDRPGGDVAVGRVPIAGVAWAPTRGISKVEVQVDDEAWQEATLGEALNANTWVQWFLPWDATQGDHEIRVRATDGTGATQTEQRTDVAPDGATGWHTIRLNVKG